MVESRLLHFLSTWLSTLVLLLAIDPAYPLSLLLGTNIFIPACGEKWFGFSIGLGQGSNMKVATGHDEETCGADLMKMFPNF